MPAPQFGSFVASELYCSKCQRAQSVRERLLLVLPTGELHEYVCATCGASLGKRTVTEPPVARGLKSAPRPSARRRLHGH
jgi:hypothetical protein